jgi:hypothetical protein
MSGRPTAAFVALVALVLAASALAAGTTVTIDLKGGIGSRMLKACAITHHYRLYRVGSPIAINGAVSPAPASFRVKLKVKRCLQGKFATVWSTGAHEASGGGYSGVFVARQRGMFFTRAYAYVGTSRYRSDKRYFQVR